MLRVSSSQLNRLYSLIITNNKTNNQIYKSNNDFTNNNIKFLILLNVEDILIF